MNQFSIKFIGDSNLCSKYLAYAKNKANELVLNKDISIKNYILKDQLNGKVCDVSINITKTLPFINVTIKTEIIKGNATTNYLSSGLSIEEINDNNVFSKFYPKETDQGFIDYSKLYRSTQLNNQYSFFKTNNSKNINQNHYLFGSQFSGKIAEQIQFLNGSTDIDIKYRFDWEQTNTIYIDSLNNYWLLTIGIVTNKDNLTEYGLYARQLSLIKQLDNTVNVSNGVVQQPISIDLIDGNGYEVNDTKILDLTNFYLGFPLSENQGWNCNKKGNKLLNVTYENVNSNINHFKSYLFEITINEIKNDDIITLQATQQIIETGELYLHENLTILFPKFANNDKELYAEQIIQANYNQVKKGSLQKFFVDQYGEFSSRNIKLDDIPIGEYKSLIQIYYDNNDELKKIYYSLKIEEIAEQKISNTGITDSSQIYQTGYYTEKDLTIKQQHKKITHGIIINNDNSRLIVDNLGIKTNYYKFELDNGTNYDDFVYKVKNNLLSVDLRPYETFYIYNDIEGINTSINTFINYVNDYYKNFKGNIPSQLSVYNGGSNSEHWLEFNTYFDIKTQLENINKLLDENNLDNTYYRINTITLLKDINKIYKINNYAVNYAPLLYKFNSNMLSVFQTFTQSYMQSIYPALESINTKIHDNLLLNENWYKTNIILKFINNFTYLKNITDLKSFNKVVLNNLINDLNTQITTINTIHNQINGIVDDINNDISNLSDFFNKMDIYNSTIQDLVNQRQISYAGFKLLNNTLENTTYNSGNTRIVDVYYQGNKYYNGIYTNLTTIENKKLTNFAIIFNYGCRNSITIYNQVNNFPVEYYSGGIKTSLTNSNEYALFKKTNTYTNNILTNETDYILIETVLNYKSYTFYDYTNFPSIYNVGDSYLNNGTTNLKFNTSDQFDYVDLVLSNFSNLSSNYTSYHFTNYNYNTFIYSNDINKVLSLKVIDKYFNQDDIILNTTIKNDFRLIKNHINKDGYIENKGDGIIYFNYARDVFTYNYVVNKNFYKYGDNIEVLTNISNYNIINSNYFVNFIGKPFD